MTNHWDGFNKNLVLYSGSRDVKFQALPWDFDYTWMGDFRPDPRPWSNNLLFDRIGKLPSVHSEVAAKVTELLEGQASPAKLLARIAYWKEIIREAYLADPKLGRRGVDLDREAQRLASEIENWSGVIQEFYTVRES